MQEYRSAREMCEAIDIIQEHLTPGGVIFRPRGVVIHCL